MVGPSTVTIAGSSARLAIVKLTRPAPNSPGETTTSLSLTLIVISAGTAGRGSFSKSSRPQPAAATTVTAARAATIALPLLRAIRGESNRSALGALRLIRDLGGDASVADRERRARLRLGSHHRQGDRPELRGDHGRGDRPDLTIAQAQGGAGLGGSREPQRTQRPVRLAAIVKAGDRLLADVAALVEVDGALDDPRLCRHRPLADLAAVARNA